MREFFDTILGDLGFGNLAELRAMRGGSVVAQRWYQDMDALLDDITTVEYEGCDIYFGVLPRTKFEGGGDAIADETSVLWADFDAKAFASKDAAFMALQSIPLEPQIVVDSGNGYHGYWLLREKVPFTEARQVMEGFMLLAGADKTYDKARILRVPGTYNHKTDPPKPVRILRFNLLARKHRIEDFVDYASASMPARGPQYRPVGQSPWGDLADYVIKAEGWEFSKPDAPKFPEGTRNNSLASLAGIMFARGMDEAGVSLALHHENLTRCDPPMDEDEVDRIVASIGRLHRG